MLDAGNGVNRLEVRGDLARRYPDVLTNEAITALGVLAPLNAERLALMSARLQRRARRVAEQRVLAFRVLPRELVADAFEYLPFDIQQELLKSLGQEQVAAILNEMAPDDRTHLLDELPGNVTNQLLNLLTPEERNVAVQLLGYPESSIGRLMTSDYVRLRPDWTVEYALGHIRRHGHDSQTLNVVYVIDDGGKLIDDIRIRKLLLAPRDAKVSDEMDDSFVSLMAADDQETAVDAMRRSHMTALPVTDSDGVLVGIVTIDDVLDVAAAEATEDIQKCGGMEALDEPYLKIAFFRMVRKRAGWLVILFLGEMLTATAMGFFENEIEKAEKGIIFGALDEKSIAWKTALRCYEEGAQIVLTNAPVARRMGEINKLAETCGNAPVIGADVTNMDDLKNLFEKSIEHFGGKIDFVLHSIGMRLNVRKGKHYTEMNYEWNQKTLDISAMRLHRVLRTAWDMDA